MIIVLTHTKFIENVIIYLYFLPFCSLFFSSSILLAYLSSDSCVVRRQRRPQSATFKDIFGEDIVAIMALVESNKRPCTSLHCAARKVNLIVIYLNKIVFNVLKIERKKYLREKTYVLTVSVCDSVNQRRERFTSFSFFLLFVRCLKENSML